MEQHGDMYIINSSDNGGISRARPSFATNARSVSRIFVNCPCTRAISNPHSHIIYGGRCSGGGGNGGSGNGGGDGCCGSGSGSGGSGGSSDGGGGSGGGGGWWWW